MIRYSGNKARLVLLLAVLFTCIKSYAQVDIGVGAEFGFPLMFNPNVKGHNHASGVPGGRVILSYTPPQSKFTASVIAGIGPMILPMTRYNTNAEDVLYMDFVNTNISLFGRYNAPLANEASLLFGIGVGATFLKGYDAQVSRRSDNEILNILEDSTFYNRTTIPSFYLNLEYVRPIKPGSDVYYGIGAQVQYVYFLDQGKTYRVDMVDQNGQYYTLKPELKGNMINPMVFLNLYYRLGSRDKY